jgi:hypothetical protein
LAQRITNKTKKTKTKTKTKGISLKINRYLVVGGLPVPRANHLHSICELAIDMQEAISNVCRREIKKEKY